MRSWTYTKGLNLIVLGHIHQGTHHLHNVMSPNVLIRGNIREKNQIPEVGIITFKLNEESITHELTYKKLSVSEHPFNQEFEDVNKTSKDLL